MVWFKRSSRLTVLGTILAVALALGLTANIPSQVQAQQNPNSLSSKLPDRWENNFSAPRVPGPSQPDNRTSGGTRGDDQCVPVGQTLIALVPPSGVGETAADYPTVFWYMPQTSASEIEFVLQDANQKDIYSAKYTLAKSANGSLTGAPGIMSLTVPAFANLPPLKAGEEYKWALALICDAADRSTDIVVEGGIKRVKADSTLASRVQRATPNERLELYAERRLWYETLATLNELGRDRSNTTEMANAWNKIFQSVGLDGNYQVSVQ